MNELRDLLATAAPKPIFSTTAITERGDAPRELTPAGASFDAVSALLRVYGADCMIRRAAIFKREFPNATYAQFSRAMLVTWNRHEGGLEFLRAIFTEGAT